MQAAHRRANEVESLRALHDLLALDTPPEPDFQALVEVASIVCEVPISLISLIDDQRQWFRANHGLPGVHETPRELSFCGHAVLTDGILEVPDAESDERFFDNPLVTGEPGIRFYAGVPVTLDNGLRIGTVCVIDRKPRQLNDTQRRILQLLAISASRALQGRAAMKRLAVQARALEERERTLKLVLDAVPSAMLYWDTRQVCRFANQACEPWFGRPLASIWGAHARELLGDVSYAQNAGRLEAALGGKRQRLERTSIRPDGTLRHSLRFYVPDIVDGEVAGVLEHVTDITPLKESEQALRREAEDLQRVNRLQEATAQAFAEAQRLGHIGSWEWDLATDVNTWSAEMFRITGRDPARPPPTVAQRLTSFLPGSRERLAEGIRRCKELGEPYSLELEFRRVSDQQLRWLDARGIPVRDAAGAVVAIRGTAQDITDAKRAEQALRKSQEFLERTGTLAGVGGWEVDLGAGTVTWSPEVCRIHGVAPDFRPTLESAIGFYTPSSRPLVTDAVQLAIATGRAFDMELEILRADGELRDVRTVGTVEMEEGKARRLSGAFQDVTERKRLAKQLAEQHELMRVTLHSIGDAVITTDRLGCVTWLNPVAERMTGWLSEEAAGRPLPEAFHIVHEETREIAPNPVEACLAEGKVVGLAHRSLLIARDGTERGIEDSAAPIRNDAGEMLGAVLVFHDVSEQRRLSSEMTYRATHDSLTGLINRAEFDNRLQRSLELSRETGAENALLYIDLDQFKLVNDACGHAAGDELLCQVSQLFRETLRSRDTLARLGGDEFAVLLTHCTTLQARRAAQAICDRLDVFRFQHDDKRFRVGASIGLVPMDRRWAHIDGAKQAADAACFAAKEGGRNRVHEWLDSDVSLRARHGQMQWASRIEKAIDHGEFVLFAQRMQRLGDSAEGQHAEVLVRLRDEDGSLIPPGAFLPAAERFHLATRVDRWVLSHATAWLARPDAQRAIGCLSVNLSGQSVGDRAFQSWVQALLDEAGESICSRLCFEITETSAVTNMAEAAVFVERARAMGVRVALDDFGAGASSFGYLKNLRVDYLKIDGQFIRDLVTDPLDEAAVRCFIDVSRILGMETVAEFVEDAAVMAKLVEGGVDYAQGYLVHRPAPIDELLNDPPDAA